MHCFTYIVFDLWFSQKIFFKKQSYYFGEFALLVRFMNCTTSGIVLSEFVLSGDPCILESLRCRYNSIPLCSTPLSIPRQKSNWSHETGFWWIGTYTAGWYVWGEWVLAVNHHNHKNWDPSTLTHNLWLIFIGIKHFFFFFEKQNSKWLTQKKCFFQNCQFSIFFLWKFHELFLGLIGLNDAKGIHVA